MKYLTALRKNNTFIFNILMLVSLGIVVGIFSSGEFILLLLPVFFLLAGTILFVPESVPFLLLISNFYGTFVFEKSFISVTVTDLFFLVVAGAYFGSKFLATPEKADHNQRTNIFSLLILLFLSALLSIFSNIPFTDDKYLVITLWYMFKFSQVLLTFYIFTDCRFTGKQIEGFISLCLALSLLQVPVVWFQLTSAMGYGIGFIKTHYAVKGTFTYHHSMLGTFMLIPLAFSLYRLLASVDFMKKVWYGIAAALFVGIIIFSGCRSALLGLVVAGVVFLVMNIKFQLKYVYYFIILIIASVLMYSFTPLKEIVQSTLYSHETQTLDLSSVSRLLIWQSALQNFTAADVLQKLFGVGIGAYSTIQNDFVLWGGLRAASGAHNNYIHVLSEIGIVGFIIFILLFYFVLRNLYNTKDLLCRSFFFLTVALLASGITQETFWFQRAFGSFWLCYMFFLAIVLQRKQRTYQ
jgi:O-antigen ligase